MIITTSYGEGDIYDNDDKRKYREYNNNSFYSTFELQHELYTAAQQRAAKEQEEREFRARIAKVTELSIRGYGVKSIANIMQVHENVIAEDLAYIAKSGGFVTMDDFVPPSTIQENNTDSYTKNNINSVKRYTASVNSCYTENNINAIADDSLQKYHTDSMPEDIAREYRMLGNPAVASAVQNAYNRLRNNSIKTRELRRSVEGKLYDADTEEGKAEDKAEQLERELAILRGIV
jgi:hypothetical protein